MKKYIIFFITWLLCILAGFFLFFVDRSSLGFVSIVNMWVKSSCIYAVLIGYVLAFAVVIALYLKDKLKHIKLEDSKKAEATEEKASPIEPPQDVTMGKLEEPAEEKTVFS